MPEGRFAAIEGDAEVFGLLLPQDLEEGVGEAEDGAHHLPPAVHHRIAQKGEVRAVDQRRSVEQKEARLALFGPVHRHPPR